MANASGLTTIRRFAAAAAVCAAFVCIVAAAPQELGERDALWVVVHDECVPNQLQKHDPVPCARVDLDDGVDKGFAILEDIKDLQGGKEFLLIPTAFIPGIESPQILAPGAPNYFADAWDAQTYLDAGLGKTLPREDIGLAVNSPGGRSQDQLHIHVECVQPEVQMALWKKAASISDHWAPLGIELYGHRYWAMWVAGERLGANNPFRLLAEGLPGAAQHMGQRTLAVIGSLRADGTAGFVILEDQVDREHGDSAHSEELLDHGCSLAATLPPKN